MEISRKNPVLALNVISQIHHLTSDYLKSELDRVGATGLVSSHGHILGCLYMEDHLPMRRIAEMIKRRKSTLTVLADKLEQEGYIQREVSPDDSRVRQISLTPKGKATQKEFEAISTRMQERLWLGFSPEEQTLLMELLTRMEANFMEADFADEAACAEACAGACMNNEPKPAVTGRPACKSRSGTRRNTRNE